MRTRDKEKIMNHILIVEDDPHIQEMLLYILEKESYQVTTACSAEDGLSYCAKHLPDLILLDIQLPGINGYQFCEQLNQQLSEMPIIIMLTDQAEVSDIEKGLNNFADDFIAKPFNPRLLVARIKANLRRGGSLLINPTPTNVSYKAIRLDTETRQAFVDEQAIKLQKMEFDILFMLISSPAKVHSRDEIITFCKGDNYYITDRAIDNQIYKLRKKLGESGKYLETVSGVGYRLSSF